MDRNRAAAVRPAAALGITLLFSSLAPAPAHAVPLTLTAPVTLTECTAGPTLIDDPTSCTATGPGASSSGSQSLAPFVTLTAQSSTSPGGGSGALVTATYSFAVIGGNPGDIVPILVETNLSADASSLQHAFGMAQTRVDTSFGELTEIVCTNGSINPTCPTLNTSFSGSFAWTSTSGEIGTIHVIAEAQSGDSGIEEWANASADPFIFIDPSFADAAKYSIIVSPGVGNALPPPPTVPEPGTLGLVASAVGMLWASRRVHHRRSSAPR